MNASAIAQLGFLKGDPTGFSQGQVVPLDSDAETPLLTITHWNHNRSNSSLLRKISITVLAGQQPQTPRHMDH